MTFGDGDRGRDRPGEGGNPDQDRKKPAEINPEDFQKKIEEIEAKRPFLRLLNMIPGKNRGRWVILPFDFSWEGVEFKGTVRILLEGGLSAELKMDRLAVDIVSESRRWLFILDKTGEAGSRMGVNIRPLQPAASRRALERELRERLGPFAAEIRVNDGETPPFADSGVEALPSVNEEV